jgi:hypothetical protein
MRTDKGHSRKHRRDRTKRKRPKPSRGPKYKRELHKRLQRTGQKVGFPEEDDVGMATP